MRNKVIFATGLGAILFSFAATAVTPVERWNDFAEQKLESAASNQTSDIIFIREQDAIAGPAVNVFVDGQYLTSLLPGAWRRVNVCAGDNRLSGGFSDPASGYREKIAGGAMWSLPADTQVFFLIKADANGQPQLEAIDPAQGKALADSLPRQDNTLSRVQANTNCAQRANPLAQALASGSATLPGVHFDSNSADLKARAAGILDEAANVLRTQSDWKVVVVGHTDSSASAAANQRLSERRAQRVAQELVSRGVAAGRLRVHGAGETSPIADNATVEGRAQNRRVELVRQQ